MREEVIDQKTNRLLGKLSKSGIIKNFYLAGGTAMALQLGHRKSIDLDWFAQKDFNAVRLKSDLSMLDKIIVRAESENTLHLNISGVKLTFLGGYSYKLLFPFLSWQGAKLADYRDIACMKLIAISSRGSKKDFIDLYFVLQNMSFGELFDLFEKKYENIKFNKLHIFKSLDYFSDADKEPMPIMLKETNWKEIKKYFKNLVKENKVFL